MVALDGFSFKSSKELRKLLLNGSIALKYGKIPSK
jgi:hypothetical protein